nr:uncharacterized protein LOC128702818 [Cherax quadricarinatus]
MTYKLLRGISRVDMESRFESGLTYTRLQLEVKCAVESKELVEVCVVVKTMLPVEVRTAVVQEVVEIQPVQAPLILVRMLLLHLLVDVNHLAVVGDLATGSWLYLGQDYCNLLLEHLGTTCRFSLQSLHLQGVSLTPGVLAEIIHRSPHLTSIHVGGDDAASEVLAYIKKNPRGLHSLHLDCCNVTDLDVVHALVKSYKDVNSWLDINASDDVLDISSPPLCHLIINSPLVTLCGAVVLLHSLRNLRSLQYSYWNSSLCNLFMYLKQQSPNSAPFSLTSVSLWRATDRALQTLSLCPRLQHLMMEYTDPSLVSMSALSHLTHLVSLTFRLVPETLILSAVHAVGKRLLLLEIEFEKYTRTPISWNTVSVIHNQCPHLQRLELHYVIIIQTPNTFFHSSTRPRSSFSELVHLNLTGVVIQPPDLAHLLCNNTTLHTLLLDINQEALTDAVLTTLLLNNQLHNLNYIYLNSGLLTIKGVTALLTLPALMRLALYSPGFPNIAFSTFCKLQLQLLKGNYQCTLESVHKDE